jgi:CHAT domain-containing protein
MSGPVRDEALPARAAARGLAIACLCAVALSAPARAQTNAASSADTAPRGAAFESALARKKDAETLLALSAEGQTLYEHDAVKLDGFGYCGQALALAEQGEFRQSIRAASKALHLGRRDADGGLQAVALRDLAIAYSYAGVLDKADDHAREALAIAGSDPVQVGAPALKVLGDVATRRERFAEATARYRESLALASERYRPLVLISLANAHTAAKEPREALAQLEQVPAPERTQPFFLRSRGNANLGAGNLAAAAADFSAVTGDAASPDADYQRLWAYEGLARVKRAQGDDAGALQDYRRSVALANSLRARFRSDEFKAGLFGDVQRIFDAALTLSVAQQDFVAAWELSEASRTRELLDTVRSRATDTLSQQLTLADVQRALTADDAVLQFHAVDEQMVVWVIRRDSIRGRTLPLREADLARRVDAFRDSIINRRADTRALGQDLYEALVAPAEIGPVKRVFLVPHGPLHYLPFQALHTGSGYLIEQYALSVWPSASVGVQLRNRANAGAATLLAFGNPTTEKNVPLPGAEREVQQLSGLFAQHSIYLQRDATKTRFKEVANSASLVHVAAHAEVDEVDPLFSRILFSSSPTDSGVLEAREIFRLDLGAVKLVTLSACESGLGKVSRGEEIVGFTRSFLSAGADSVIASLWPVADDSTEALMTKLYQELVAGRDLGSAMQAAQIEVQRNRRFAHPFFWAPFYVIGNGQLKLAS